MALDPRKRQKKVERRKAKQREKQKSLALHNPADWRTRIARSAAAPIVHCCTNDALWERGIGIVLVSRESAGGQVVFVVFLVDMYCLGVKDVTFNVAPRGHYDFKVYGAMFPDATVVKLKPECARKLVEGAVAYAGDLGLAPHADYEKARLIFGDIDASLCTKEFTYGKDGKPFFVAGPYDSPARCNRIMNTLVDRCGPDGFHSLMPIEAAGMLPSDVRILDSDEDDDA